MKTVIESTQFYELVHHVGDAKYSGCSCGFDCDCCFDSTHYDYYTVKKLRGKIRTTNHKNIEDARSRIKQL